MRNVKKSLPVFLMILAGMFTSCNAKTNSTTETATPASTEPITQQNATTQTMTTENPNWESTDGLYAVFNTNKGKIVCQLEYAKIPMTVGNFVSLCEGNHPKAAAGKPFYDGLGFHRVIANFMIQGGDPQGNGSGGPGYSFPDEFDASLRHATGGILSMANAGPGTNGSQFFITHVATPWLNDKHTIFGHVVSGMSIVNAIAQGDKMETVRIIRVGKSAKDFNAVASFTKGSEGATKKREEEMKKGIAEWDGKVKAKFPTAQKTASGLYYVVDKPGTGAKATKGQTVVAHYTGTLWDGKKFDSSVDRGQPFEFAVGTGQVIPGWDEGFMLFNIGAKGKLIIPARMAYGDRGAGGVIPPNADLIFEVEMLGVK
jgi:peptidyl-prolyl cis-trans isomerase A (cyclophilin A)